MTLFNDHCITFLKSVKPTDEPVEGNSTAISWLKNGKAIWQYSTTHY